MGSWFGHGSRGFVLGLWSACASIGNIMGSWIASIVLQYGYEYCFLINGVMLIAGALVIFFALVSSPRDVGKEL
jgi:OPA family glycerol-3-phosphate transporter-like MFS transporter 3